MIKILIYHSINSKDVSMLQSDTFLKEIACTSPNSYYFPSCQIAPLDSNK